MGYSEIQKRMEVLSLHPDVSLRDVQDKTGFEIGAASDVTETGPPSEEELDILRNSVDPTRAVIGRG